ncbi:hypothetical protein X975_25491, partial [Stegodyphus mimosarum]
MINMWKSLYTEQLNKLFLIRMPFFDLLRRNMCRMIYMK